MTKKLPSKYCINIFNPFVWPYLHATLAGPDEPADALLQSLSRALHPLAVSHGDTITDASQQGYTRHRALPAGIGLLPSELIDAHVRTALLALQATPMGSNASSESSDYGDERPDGSPFGAPDRPGPGTWGTPPQNHPLPTNPSAGSVLRNLPPIPPPPVSANPPMSEAATALVLALFPQAARNIPL